jgi:hypothetical protein
VHPSFLLPVNEKFKNLLKLGKRKITNTHMIINYKNTIPRDKNKFNGKKKNIMK